MSSVDDLRDACPAAYKALRRVIKRAAVGASDADLIISDFLRDLENHDLWIMHADDIDD